ncbi:diguanylate cyclase [Desulfococcus sp.]|uniref:GGDEF domain-containing protein n=1 Tax=Desulfococcus sp. TaxID=2025834 RepID=UPI003D0DE992
MKWLGLLMCLTFFMGGSQGHAFVSVGQAQMIYDGKLPVELQNHTIMALLIDPESGAIVDANRKAVVFYGYPLDRMRGMRIQEINILDPRDVEAEYKRAEKEDRNYFIFPHRLADGEVRTVEVYSAPVPDSSGKRLLLSIIHDATHKALMEAELNRYKDRLETLVAQRTRQLSDAHKRIDRLSIFGLLVVSGLLFFLLRRHQKAVYFQHRFELERERQRSEAALMEREERFQRMLALVPDMITIQDPEMNILYSNWNGMGAVEPEKRILGTKCHQTYRGYDDICPDCRPISVLDTKTPFQEEIRLPDGTWLDMRVIPILDANGEVECFAEWARDITENYRTRERLERLATTDALTELWNRAYFMGTIRKEMERARRYGEPFSLLMLDLDHFKRVNDTRGHAAGDAALRHVAAIFRKSLRQTDIAGRVGGEEFSILLPHTDLAAALVMAERLRSTIENTPADYNGTEIPLTSSIGVAVYDREIADEDALMLLADEALYAAKKGGRNRVCQPPREKGTAFPGTSDVG